MEEKVAADTGKIGMSIGQESMYVTEMVRKRYVPVVAVQHQLNMIIHTV